MKRMTYNRPPKYIHERMPKGRIKRGRPKLIWAQTIRKRGLDDGTWENRAA